MRILLTAIFRCVPPPLLPLNRKSRRLLINASLCLTCGPRLERFPGLPLLVPWPSAFLVSQPFFRDIAEEFSKKKSAAIDERGGRGGAGRRGVNRGEAKIMTKQKMGTFASKYRRTIFDSESVAYFHCNAAEQKPWHTSPLSWHCEASDDSYNRYCDGWSLLTGGESYPV